MVSGALGSAVFSAVTVVLLMVIVLPLSLRGPIESVARLVSRFANISFYRYVGLSTSPPSDSLLIQCLLSSRLLGVRARSSPNLRPDPWGGIGHTTGNPAGLDGAGTGARRSDYCPERRDGAARVTPTNLPRLPSASRKVAPVDRRITSLTLHMPPRWHPATAPYAGVPSGASALFVPPPSSYGLVKDH